MSENNAIKQSPVLLITFNRPDTTEKVLEAIRIAKRPKLYVAMDGPRQNNISDLEAQKKIKELVLAIDWECDVRTLYREENVGCGFGPADAISWAFTEEDRMIILEDDCLPSQSFFSFCDELLELYKDDERVGRISGRSYPSEKGCFGGNSYLFSRWAHTWGWATWKRCWEEFDIRMTDYPQYKEMGGVFCVFPIKRCAKLYEKKYDKIYDSIEKEITHSWDAQWEYTGHKNNWVGIVPSKNLIKNIGVEGTHSFGVKSSSHTMDSQELNFPLCHPAIVLPDLRYENIHFRNHILAHNATFLKRVMGRIRRLFK